MPDIIEILSEIPEKEEFESTENTEVVVNSVLCVVRFSIFEFKVGIQTCDARILDWLNRLEFCLKEWNDARKIISNFSGVRNSKIRAIQDVVEHFRFDKNFVMQSTQLKLIPGLNKSLMSLPAVEQGIQLAKDRYEEQFKITSTILPQKMTNSKIPSHVRA